MRWLILIALLIASPALANDRTPCWKIRKWVKDYGYAQVMAYARFNGYSDRDIERGKRCLR